MDKRRLHLGCFDQPVEGWINTDITPHIFVSRVPGAAALLHKVGRLSDRRLEQHRQGVFKQVRYMNVGKRLPFPDQSMDAVFSSHLLEHLPPAVARGLLRECRRVLTPGGVIRIGVPDLDQAVSMYSAGDPEAFLDTVFEGSQTGKNAHRWMYNESLLGKELAGAGFSSYARQAFQHGKCPDLHVLDNRPEITLFVEGYA